ncbi:dihydrofolate reductase family protein [Jiangella gansuensis]|uniref:dihydrofolate reductase family protein n=1 Tax=Jiangella gansuensis TaxID=281473 RepID=UPI00047D891B|nr:dihydrofolate reductase family protein [Jiangella gansuensis]
MGKVYTHMTMSLDGFIAEPDDQIGELFEWYDAGDTTVQGSGMVFNVDAASAVLLQEFVDTTGALVAGRRLFDITDGWNDNHPVGSPVVVVTHNPPADADRWPRTAFVDGVEAAVDRARQVAGEKDVCIASADVAQQALELGVVDEVCVSLVPVLFGTGKPYFSTREHLLLDDPVVIPGRRATHLRYPVRRS